MGVTSRSLKETEKVQTLAIETAKAREDFYVRRDRMV